MRALAFCLLLLGLISLLAGGGFTASAPEAAGERPSSGKACFACHDEIRNLYGDGSRHAGLDCTACHSALDSHLSNTGVPFTSTDPALCGKCHQDQYESLYKVNLRSKARVEKATPAGRAPLLDKLLAGHGFTKEHNEPRSHVFMLVDHVVVDRSFAGRFQLKDWGFIDRPGKLWDVVEDTGKELPETAKAANPTCMQCKSDDNILRWGYMGDKSPKAKWDRTSLPAEYARSVQNPMGCIHCHDPHATKPRIVRDALIEAVERDGAAPYGDDRKKGWVKTVEFRGFRRIALLPEYDANLLCGQCHVEYNCNGGLDPVTGEKIGFDDRRTNHFPLKNVFDIQKHYDGLRFRDFRHAATGAPLIKAQHPEMESFWGSRHEKAGLTCADCHMPKMRNAAGKTYTSHWQTSPRNYLGETCGVCHADWNAQEAEYRIDAVQNYVRGKMRKAEAWLSKLIDTYEAAKRSGVAPEILAQAQRHHDTAHILWEWWTAENSDGFHNPDQARESLARSVAESRKGVELLEGAMKR